MVPGSTSGPRPGRLRRRLHCGQHAVAYLIADHSSSDSSPSSLVAVGLGGLGFLSVVLGAAVFIGAALARVWRGSGRASRHEVTPAECLLGSPAALSPATRPSASRAPCPDSVVAA